MNNNNVQIGEIFFVKSPGMSYIKKPLNRHRELTQEEYDKAGKVNCVVGKGFICIDADCQRATDFVNEVCDKLGLKPYQYTSSIKLEPFFDGVEVVKNEKGETLYTDTYGKHTHFWFKTDDMTQNFIDTLGLHSVSAFSPWTPLLDIRSYNTITGKNKSSFP